MTARWRERSLAEICTVFADGDWVESKDQSEEGIRLIQTGNVGKGEFKDREEKARYISESTFTRLKCTEIFKGDCLISRLPDPVGRSCILPINGQRMITAVDCTIVRFKPGVIIPKFFVYYSQSDRYLRDVDTETTGTTRKRISRAHLGAVRLPIPPIDTQQRIVAILDKTFAAIATAKVNTEKNLLNARALLDTSIEQALSPQNGGWRTQAFGDVCEIASVLVDPRRKEYIELPHVGGANITSKTGQLVDLRTAREEKLISGKFAFDESAVLYSKIRPYLMKVARPSFVGLCSADIYPLSPKRGQLNRDFLYYLLLGPKFTTYAVQGSARAGMPKVNRDHLFAFKCELPEIQEQQRINAGAAARLQTGSFGVGASAPT